MVLVLVLEKNLSTASTARLNREPESPLPGVTETKLSLFRNFVNNQQIVSVAQ